MQEYLLWRFLHTWWPYRPSEDKQFLSIISVPTAIAYNQICAHCSLRPCCTAVLLCFLLCYSGKCSSTSNLLKKYHSSDSVRSSYPGISSSLDFVIPSVKPYWCISALGAQTKKWSQEMPLHRGAAADEEWLCIFSCLGFPGIGTSWWMCSW